MADPRAAGGEALLALSQFFVEDSSIGDTLLRVTELACQVAPADMAGITMLVEGKLTTGIFTDPDAPEIDEAQYQTGQGPCLDAFRNKVVYRIDSTTNDDRWPEFALAAGNHGILSTLSVPVVARDESFGALNLYARQAAAFDEIDAEHVGTFARHAASVLANARVYWDSRRLNENLNQTLRSRALIDQATAILMATGRTSQEAFQVLVRASQRENRMLRDIASEIVDRAALRELGIDPT